MCACLLLDLASKSGNNRHMQSIAIANQKGGTGKTATAHNVGALLAAAGRRVLLIDSDPQASLTDATLASRPAGDGLAEVLRGAKIAGAINQVQDNLDIIAADISLASVELELVGRIGRENILQRAIAGLSDRYEIVIIDCPPSLSLLTVNALTAARGVLIPTQPQAQDLRGLKLFMGTLEQIREALNPSLQVIGILPTFYDPRLNHHNQALDTMRAAGLPVLDVFIKRTVKIAEAAGVSQSLAEYAPDNSQMEAYKKLSEVIIQWLAKAKNNRQ